MALPMDVEAPARARRIVAELATGLDRWRDVVIATSELVSNVVRHAPHARSAELEARRDGCTIRVTVRQTGVPMERGRSARPNGNGRGLAIVEAVSDRWGIDGNGDVAVWFEVTA